MRRDVNLSECSPYMSAALWSFCSDLGDLHSLVQPQSARQQRPRSDAHQLQRLPPSTTLPTPRTATNDNATIQTLTFIVRRMQQC
jgi:hypothetical protein